MNLSSVQRILGILLMLFSVTMLPPILVSMYYRDGNWRPFVDAFAALLAIGASCMVARSRRAVLAPGPAVSSG